MGQGYASMVFQPPPSPSYNSEDLEGFFYIQENDRKVPAVWLEYKGEEGPAAFTILYSSGSVEDLGYFYEWLRDLRSALHVNVIAYEYAGYGYHASPNVKPSEKSCNDDILSVYRFLINQKKISPEKIILFGRSLGTGPSIHLSTLISENISIAKKKKWKKGNPFPEELKEQSIPPIPIGGLVLQSTMMSVLSINQDIRNKFLVPDMFENLKKAEKVVFPTLLVHGSTDELIPLKHSKKMVRALPNVVRFVVFEEGTHTNLEDEFSTEFIDELKWFSYGLLNSNDLKSITTSHLNKIYSNPPSWTKSKPQKPLASWFSQLTIPSFSNPFKWDEYLSKFNQAGYYDLYGVGEMDETDLSLIGVSDQQHRNFLSEEIKKLSDTNLLPKNTQETWIARKIAKEKKLDRVNSVNTQKRESQRKQRARTRLMVSLQKAVLTNKGDGNEGVASVVLMELDELKSKLESVSDLDRSNQSFWEEWESETLSIANEVDKLKQSISNVDQRIQQQTQSFNSQTTLISEKIASELNLQKFNESWKEVISKGKELPKKLTSEKEELKTQIEQVKSKFSEGKTRSETNRNELSNQVEDAKSAFSKESESLKQQIDQQMEQIVLLDASNSKLREELTALKLKLLEENASQSKDLNQLHSEFQRQKSTLEQERTKFQQQLQHSRAKKALLEQSRQNLEKEWAQTNDLSSQLTSDSNQLKDEIQSSGKKSVETLKEEVEKLESEALECENSNKIIKSKMDEMQKKQPVSFSSHRLQQNDSSATQKDKQALNEKLQALESKIQSLKKELAQ